VFFQAVERHPLGEAGVVGDEDGRPIPAETGDEPADVEDAALAALTRAGPPDAADKLLAAVEAGTVPAGQIDASIC
jgi:hypothetical protein